MEKIKSLTELDSAIMKKLSFFKIEDNNITKISGAQLLSLSLLEIINMMSDEKLYAETIVSKLDVKTIVKSTIK